MDPIQYAIDIAARMSGGNQTIAELDQLASGFMAAGKRSESLSSAIARVSNDLDAVRSAGATSNAALAEATEEYRALERAAVQASKSFEKAALKGVVPPELAASVEAATVALDQQASKLKTLEANAKAASASEAQLVKTLGNLKTINQHVDRSFAQQAESLSKVQGALGTFGGPLGTLGQRLIGPVKGFEELSATMGAATATSIALVAGMALVVVGLVALSAAAIAGVAAVTKWAVTLGDAARSARLAREAVETLRPDLVALRGAIADISGDTGIAETALVDLQKSLKDARVSAAQMPAALRAAALAEAALGKGGSAEFVANIKAGKLAVSDFATEAERSFGGVVARQMLGLEAQSSRLGRAISDTFGGLNIEPALMGVKVLVDLFDKTTISGQAMKFLFESIFQPLIDQATNAAYVIEAFVLGFLIGLTKLYIAVKPVIRAVSEFLGLDDVRLENVLTMAKNAGELLAPVIAAVVAGVASLTVIVGLAAIGFGVFMAAIVAVQLAIVAFAAAVVYGSVQVWVAIREGVGAAIDWLTTLPSRLTALGSQMIQGLVNGITGSAGAVVGAIGGVVNGAISSAKRALGIASPSKVFAGLGEFTGEGFVEGVEGMTGASHAAMGALVEAPESALSAQDALSGNLGGSAQKSTAEAPATGAGGPMIDLRGASLTFAGKDAPSSIKQFAEMLTKCFEGDAAMIGAEVLIDG